MEFSLIVIGNLICDDENVDDLIKCDILSVLSQFMSNQLPDIRRITVWCIANLAGGRIDHINALINSGIINKIFDCVNDTN